MSSSCRPENLYVYESQQNPGRGLCTRKTDLSPSSNLLLTVPMRCFCSGLFLLSLFICFLLVFDYSFISWIALWPSAGKELTSWLSTYVVLHLCRLNCLCFFPVWCLEHDVELDCIGSSSLHFHLLFMWSLYDRETEFVQMMKMAAMPI